MAKPVLLNKIDHRDLRIDVRSRGAAFGDEVMFALTFPDEFRSVQAHYPVVFHKTAEGLLQPVALFGFRPGQNLFLDGARWDAHYLPLAIERQPFLIGRAGQELVVHIDPAHPRVGAAGGEAAFDANGDSSAMLERLTSVLLSLHDGLQRNPAFVAALLQHDLLEAFVLDVTLDDGSQHRFAGFYTIAEEKLRKLGTDALAQLHRAGYVEPIYMAIASLSNFRDLIERMNRRDAGAR
jgi:hypothetical protein